jgi:hypothetical protein
MKEIWENAAVVLLEWDARWESELFFVSFGSRNRMYTHFQKTFNFSRATLGLPHRKPDSEIDHVAQEKIRGGKVFPFSVLLTK